MGNPELAVLWRKQFGIATLAQAMSAGGSERTLRRARVAGVYELVLPGVLRSAEHPDTFESRAMAVQLYLGDRGALSGPTAGRLYGLRAMPTARVWACAASPTRVQRPSWLKLAAAPRLLIGPDAVRSVRGWRLLAPASTLLTLAEQFNDHRFEQAAEDAWHLRLITPMTAAVFLDEHRGPGRRGVARFERWLAGAGVRQRPSQSSFEVDVIDALRRVGLPEPARQHPVTLLSGEVVHLDIAWPEVLLAVEPGHSWWHGGDARTRRDQARDRACGLVGWHVMRYDQAARSDLSALATEVEAMYVQRLR